MGVDLGSSRPLLGAGVGGLSGPAIRPVALRMVWEICNAVALPVIAVGGIATVADAVEFLSVGARAVQIGTANFARPDAMIRIIDGLAKYVNDHGHSSVQELVGTLRAPALDPTAARG